jgi:hypothetical protein
MDVILVTFRLTRHRMTTRDIGNTGSEQHATWCELLSLDSDSYWPQYFQIIHKWSQIQIDVNAWLLRSWDGYWHHHIFPIVAKPGRQVLVLCSIMNKICKRTNTAVAFTQEYSGVSYPLRNMSTLSTGSASSKDTHWCRRCRTERTSKDLESMFRGKDTSPLYFELLVSTGLNKLIAPIIMRRDETKS